MPLNLLFFIFVQVYETVNHEINRWVEICISFQRELLGSMVFSCVFCLNWCVWFLLTGPLRVLAVLLLVGLTWLLAITFFGGESGSSVRHFFSGRRSSVEMINWLIGNQLSEQKSLTFTTFSNSNVKIWEVSLLYILIQNIDSLFSDILETRDTWSIIDKENK